MANAVQPVVSNSPTGRDHIELDLGLLAGVTDRGVRHERNEDAMALATAQGPVAIAVVCDGVSSSTRPDEASLTASRTGADVLLAAARLGVDPGEASLEAMRLASGALAGLRGPDGAPSATYITAVVTQDEATVCWLGDSRAYWLAAEGSQRLTDDDSLAAEMVAVGMLDEDEAMTSPHAHVITRWLGADVTDPQAHLVRFAPPGPGVVMLCSDGLWNYLPEADDLAALALPDALHDPLTAAAAMVKFAVDEGGIDNITAVLIPVPLNPARAPRS
jgi:serine/threonine protein phosphatase PrpC